MVAGGTVVETPSNELFSWDNIIGEDASAGHSKRSTVSKEDKKWLTGPLKRRLEKINDKTKESHERETDDISAKKKLRRVALKHVQSSISKFVPAALRPQFGTTVVFGESDRANFEALPLTGSTTGVVSEADAKIKRLIDRAMLTPFGEKLRNRMRNFPVSADMTEARTISLKRQAKAAIGREIQAMKRLKKIKSKAFRKHHRNDEEKDAQTLLARLQEMDPEAADNLREDFDRKRAELRLSRQSQARRKWAKAAARFGGREAQKLINQQLSNEAERRRLFNSLSVNQLQDGEDSTDDDDDNNNSASEEEGGGDSSAMKYTKKVNKLLKDVHAIANENETATSSTGGIANMKFMKLGRERRRQELNREAESFVHYLSEGMTPKQAAVLSSQNKVDDFLLQANDLKDPETQQREHLAKKRAAAAAATSNVSSTNSIEKSTQAPIFKAEDFRLDKEMAELGMVGTVRKDKKKKTKDKTASGARDISPSSVGPSSVSPAVGGKRKTEKIADLEESGGEDGSAELDGAAMIEQNLLVKMAFNMTDIDGAIEEFDEEVRRDEEKEAERNQVQRENKRPPPGWGSWTVTAVEDVKRPVSVPKRSPAQRSTVKHGVTATVVPDKYVPVVLADGTDTAEEHNMLMQTAVGPEWLPEVGHSEMIRPEYRAVGGRVIEAMKFDADVKRMLVERQLEKRGS